MEEKGGTYHIYKGEKEGIPTHQERTEGVEGDEVRVSHHGATSLGSRVL